MRKWRDESPPGDSTESAPAEGWQSPAPRWVRDETTGEQVRAWACAACEDTGMLFVVAMPTGNAPWPSLAETWDMLRAPAAPLAATCCPACRPRAAYRPMGRGLSRPREPFPERQRLWHEHCADAIIHGRAQGEAARQAAVAEVGAAEYHRRRRALCAEIMRALRAAEKRPGDELTPVGGMLAAEDPFGDV